VDTKEVATQLGTMKRFWTDRYARRGVGVVGRENEDHRIQTQRIIDALKPYLDGAYFENGLDFGTGWGRLLPYLINTCGHVWAIDIVPKAIELLVTNQPQYCTPILIQNDYELPMRDGSMDLIFVSLVLQHIVDDALFNKATHELRRVARKEATIVIIDNAVDKAYHVRSRSAADLAQALGLNNYLSEKITINARPNDHWLIVGKRG
jgi:ubiquinone/menaquinone biosynthesis C-methylase UbiE